jgi:hypothetical protein
MGEVMSRLPVLKDRASSPLHIAERLLGEDEDCLGVVNQRAGRGRQSILTDMEVLNDETCRADS